MPAAGVDFEVVPGVTSGVAAPAYAGIPVTHRDDASAVAFVTGHEDPAKPETALDWEALAASRGRSSCTWASRTCRTSRELIEAGRDPAEPAAAVERGTLPGQTAAVATLETLAAEVERQGLRPPSILLFGPVAARREDIAWLERRPLHGKRVVVTRARAQASGMARTLEALGAEVVELPAIRIEPRIETDEVRAAVESLHTYALVCVTSPNGARLLFEAMADAGPRRARALAGAGGGDRPGHRRALRERGRHRGRGARALRRGGAGRGARRGAGRGQAGPGRTRRRGARRPARCPPRARRRGRRRGALRDPARVPAPEEIEAAMEADYVTFTSSSTVKNFLEVTGGRVPEGARIVSIGPVTSETAREAGIEVTIEAGRHDPEGLIDALVEDAGA